MHVTHVDARIVPAPPSDGAPLGTLPVQAEVA